MSTENKNKAIARLIELLKQEAFLLPPVPDEQDLEEVIVEANNNQGGLEASFEELWNRAKKDEPEGHEETEEMVVESFLKFKLEKQNLACWAKFEENSNGSHIKLASKQACQEIFDSSPQQHQH